MNIQQAATSLLLAEENKQPIAPFTSSTEEISVEEAYAIQLFQINEKLKAGATVKGLKIGLTSKVMQEMFNVDTPDFGHILDDMVFDASEPINHQSFIQPKVEFEIAFILKEDLQGPGITAEDVLAATDYVVPAIEIIDSRIADWQFKFEDTVADNGSSAGVVLGTQRTAIQSVDLSQVVMRAYHNGELFDEATGAAVMGHPANAVAWLANMVGVYDIPLKKGYFILAGALSKAVPFIGGDSFTAKFEGLGEVSVMFNKEGDNV